MTFNVTFSVTKNGVLTVKTHRSGHFTFEIGLDYTQLDTLKQLTEQAYARFASMPKVGDIANQLERLSVVTSVYSTNTIEGGDLTEEETANVLNQDPTTVKKQSDQRVVNLKSAYNLAEDVSKMIFLDVSEEEIETLKIPGTITLNIKDYMIKDLHKIITHNLEHEDNIPGQYRNNPRERRTQVGDKNHGGVYAPPKCLNDIKLLIDAYVYWANSPPVSALPPLYRAPLLHYYFERIHPFWDGNGRTGRVVEAMVLQAANYKYVPYANAKFYLDNIDTYFTLFNTCRKRAVKRAKDPNTDFVRFHLTATLSTVNRLQDNANHIISKFLFDANLNFLHTTKKINDRQHTVISQLSTNPATGLKGSLSVQPWYTSLYRNLTDRTKIRDINKLIELELIVRNKNGDIVVEYEKPNITLANSPITSIEYT